MDVLQRLNHFSGSDKIRFTISDYKAKPLTDVLMDTFVWPTRISFRPFPPLLGYENKTAKPDRRCCPLAVAMHRITQTLQ